MPEQLWTLRKYAPPEAEMRAVLSKCNAHMYLVYFMSSGGTTMSPDQLNDLWLQMYGGYCTLAPQADITPLCASTDDLRSGGMNWTECDVTNSLFFPNNGSTNQLPCALWVLVTGSDLPSAFQGDEKVKTRYKYDDSTNAITLSPEGNALNNA